MDIDNLFSGRSEIEKLMEIIAEWQKSHPGDSKSEYADEIFDKLDYLHMIW